MYNWNTTSIENGLDEIGRSRGELLSYLRDLLNDFYDIDRSIEYYDLVAGMWLESFMQNIYCAWCEVLEGNVPGELSDIPVIHCPEDVWELTKDIRWHQHLRGAVSRLIDGETVKFWKFDQRRALSRDKLRHRLAQKFFSMIATSKPIIILTDPYFKCSCKEWLRAIWRWRKWISVNNLRYPIYVSVSIDTLWRKNKSATHLMQSYTFSDLAMALIPLYIPVTLLEGFEIYRLKVLKLNLHRPLAVYSATALYSNLTFNLLIAEWRQYGTKLLYHQHGGGYGMEKNLVVESYESRVADQYYSWGWTRASMSVKPLSPAMTFHTPRFQTDKILLVTTDYPNLPYRLMHTPMPGTIEVMHQDVCEFLTSFSKKENLIIRPYPVDYGWGILEAMRSISGGATFNSKTKLSSLIEGCRLIVCSYLGTTWLETLGLNIPTVCFYDPESYLFRDEVRSSVAALHDVGILHSSGREAAFFIANLGGDVESWWKSSKVQVARINFVKRYANFSSNWMTEWEKEFQSIVEREHSASAG